MIWHTGSSVRINHVAIVYVVGLDSLPAWNMKQIFLLCCCTICIAIAAASDEEDDSVHVTRDLTPAKFGSTQDDVPLDLLEVAEQVKARKKKTVVARLEAK